MSQNGAVRTKYDRMFERKNQDILTEHYSKIVDRSSDEDSEDEFLKLKRVDHALPETTAEEDYEQIQIENLSKRQQRLGKAKRALKDGGSNMKLVFDDEGLPHEIYELEEHEAVIEGLGGYSGVDIAGVQFAIEERAKMNVTDTLDKMEARDKKLEKKRKRKERENEDNVVR